MDLEIRQVCHPRLLVFQTGTSPRVDPITALLRNYWRQTRALKLDRTITGHIHLQLLFEDYLVVRELIVNPKLARRQRLGLVPVAPVLQDVADTESLHRKMFFAHIAIERGLARNLRGHILEIIQWR